MYYVSVNLSLVEKKCNSDQSGMTISVGMSVKILNNIIRARKY